MFFGGQWIYWMCGIRLQVIILDNRYEELDIIKSYPEKLNLFHINGDNDCRSELCDLKGVYWTQDKCNFNNEKAGKNVRTRSKFAHEVYTSESGKIFNKVWSTRSAPPNSINESWIIATFI